MMNWEYEFGKGILWGNPIKPLEVVENKEYHCAHTPCTAKAKSLKRIAKIGMKWRM